MLFRSFNLVKGKIGSSVGQSAIALKADAIRIIGTGGIKLVTRANSHFSSSDESVVPVSGIELIAGNDDSFLQPMVKGDNLKECLQQIISYISDVQGQVHSTIKYVDKVVDAFSNHTHTGFGYSPPINVAVAKTAKAVEGVHHSSEDHDHTQKSVEIEKTYFQNNNLKLNNLYLYIDTSFNVLRIFRNAIRRLHGS